MSRTSKPKWMTHDKSDNWERGNKGAINGSKCGSVHVVQSTNQPFIIYFSSFSFLASFIHVIPHKKHSESEDRQVISRLKALLQFKSKNKTNQYISNNHDQLSPILSHSYAHVYNEYSATSNGYLLNSKDTLKVFTMHSFLASSTAFNPRVCWRCWIRSTGLGK